MPTNYAILGQSAPAATVLTALYTVPAATQSIGSSIVCCNTSAVADVFRVSVAPLGAADAIAQYQYYDIPILANDTFIATIGFTLGATDVVRCYSLNGTCSFTLYGNKIT